MPKNLGDYRVIYPDPSRVMLGDQGDPLVDPMEHAGIGPLQKYSISPDGCDVVLVHHGRRPGTVGEIRPADEAIDFSKQYYFVIHNCDEEFRWTHGPMDEAMFEEFLSEHPIEISWTSTHPVQDVCVSFFYVWVVLFVLGCVMVVVRWWNARRAVSRSDHFR